MAEELHKFDDIKKHLNEEQHVFKDGHAEKLSVQEWNRNTPADGNYLNDVTIKPLTARDLYLAECIDELSAKDITYTAGNYINISPVSENPKTYQINLDNEYKPFRYKFGDGFHVSVPSEEGEVDVTVNLKTDDEFIKMENGAIYCNASEIEEFTKDVNNVSATITENKINSEFKYSMGNTNLKVTDLVPDTITATTVYLIG